MKYNISVSVVIRRRFSDSCIWATMRQTHQSLCVNVASHNFIMTKIKHDPGKVDRNESFKLLST